jgi:hypothetical protein
MCDHGQLASRRLSRRQFCNPHVIRFGDGRPRRWHGNTCDDDPRGRDMHKLSCVVGLLVILNAPPMMMDSTAQILGGPTKSEVIGDCGDAKGCIPGSTSLVVVYVYDIAGYPVADMTVAAEGSSKGPGWSRLPIRSRTDHDGMAAFSVKPGVSYSLRIADPGWIPLNSETKMALPGGIQLFRVVMKVPPIH